MVRIAVLDDYNRAARTLADWSAVDARATVDVIDRPLAVPEEAAEVLAPYDVLCHLRERTAMPRTLVERLPRLRLVTVTGGKHRTLDMAAATERGIVVSADAPRKGGGSGTSELTWGLILALARHIPHEERQLRAGKWQSTMGITLAGRTLGLVGLGRVGKGVATIARAFGMEVQAWSPNLTAERCAECGAQLATKDELFRTSDVISLHLVLGERSRGIVGTNELALMKPTALLINTARGPLIDEAALLETLSDRRIAGAGLDVFWQEPLKADHPLLAMDNVVLTPHLGYVVDSSLRPFYEDTVANVLAWLDGRPIRVLNPDALQTRK